MCCVLSVFWVKFGFFCFLSLLCFPQTESAVSPELWKFQTENDVKMLGRISRFLVDEDSDISGLSALLRERKEKFVVDNFEFPQSAAVELQETTAVELEETTAEELPDTTTLTSSSGATTPPTSTSTSVTVTLAQTTPPTSTSTRGTVTLAQTTSSSDNLTSSSGATTPPTSTSTSAIPLQCLAGTYSPPGAFCMEEKDPVLAQLRAQLVLDAL